MHSIYFLHLVGRIVGHLGFFVGFVLGFFVLVGKLHDGDGGAVGAADSHDSDGGAVGGGVVGCCSEIL